MGGYFLKKTINFNNLQTGVGRLDELRSRLEARASALSAVRSALPDPLARRVASAGLEAGCLTVGVVGAAWASRLRYVTQTLRTKVAAALGEEIVRVRIRVVPPPPA